MRVELLAGSQTVGSVEGSLPFVGDALFEALPAAVYVCDKDGVVLHCNERATELWGRTPKLGDPSERFCGSLHLHTLQGEPLAHAQCPMADVLRTGRPVRDQEVIIERPDGSRIVALVNIAPLHDAAGQVVGAVNCFVDITERQRTEQELRASKEAVEEGERRVRELLESLPVAVYTTDAQGRITFYNGAALELWGCRPEIGKSEWCGSWRLYWPDGRPMAHDQCPMAIALREGRAIRGYEAIAERPDGTRVPFIPYPTPLRDRAGNIIGAINMLIDITERKRSEELIRNREQRLSAIFAQASAGVAETDVTGRFVLVNDRYCAITGRSREELLRLSMQDITHIADLPRNMALFRRAVEHGKPFEIEKRYIRPDGSPVWVNNSVFPVIGPSGRVENVTAISIEISERKRAEQLQLRLASIIESSDDAIVSKNLLGIVQTWNKGAERLFGYTADEMIGRSITMIIPDDRLQEETDILARIRRGERMEHYETVRRRKDGSLVDISLSISPMVDSDGNVIGASKIARDISERKRRDEQIALLARETDHRAKNLLALVQAIVHLTSGDDIAKFKQAVDGRLRALANTHKLLSGTLWTGADIAELIEHELLPYLQEGNPRAKLSGPNIVLEPQLAQSLALAVHELTTNAVKYGALSVPSGQLEVDWQRTEDGRIRVRWIESGGPPVSAPRRFGFGTNVMARVIRDQLNGEFVLDWRPQGLSCELTVAPSTAAAHAATQEAGQGIHQPKVQAPPFLSPPAN